MCPSLISYLFIISSDFSRWIYTYHYASGVGSLLDPAKLCWVLCHRFVLVIYLCVEAIDDAIENAIENAVECAIATIVDAIENAIEGAVDDTIDDVIKDAIKDAIKGRY